MKIIKYQIATEINCGTEMEPQFKVTLSEIIMGWNERNEEIAKKEAYNGEYTVEDDGIPEIEETPTQLDIIEAQVAYTAMMTDTLLMEE
jgi:hypothetical protein